MTGQAPPFKIEINTPDGSISYTRRMFGEVGKDILAIKFALGVIQDTTGLIHNTPDGQVRDVTIPLDHNGWFDCLSGRPISVEQAATFDSKMQRALTMYQSQNQFLILCYLFEKYGVKNLLDATSQGYSSILVEKQEEYSRSILQQLDAMEVLFNQELGNLGEATLAIMHGWLPHTTISNTGYVHSSAHFFATARETVVDVLPEVLIEDFDSGRLGQTKEDLLNSGFVQDSIKYNNLDELGAYLEIVSSNTQWLDGNSSIFPYGSIRYNILRENISVLYSFSKSTIENYNSNQLAQNMQTPQQATDNLRRVFYPDPFVATEPFYISQDKTGYYLETEFLLSAEGPLPSYDEEVIKDMEDKALDEVVKKNSKTNVWYLPTMDEFVSTTLFGSDGPKPPEHIGFYPIGSSKELKKNIERFVQIKRKITETEEQMSLIGNFNSSTNETLRLQVLQQKIDALAEEYEEDITAEDKINSFWVLSTEPGAARAAQSEEGPTVQTWRDVDGWGNEPPMVKFIEFKTPSMRPGQHYRALFELSTRKLDLIKDGLDIPIATPNAEPEEAQSESTQDDCAPGDISEAIRTKEEYRVHARKKRREIVRKLREEAQRSETARASVGQSPTIDLGKQGPFDLNSALKSILGMDLNGASDHEYTRMVLSKLGDVGTNVFQKLDLFDTDAEYFNNIANDSNKELKKKDANGRPQFSALQITLEEMTERINIIVKDLQESAEIISSEGIVFKKGSKFNAKEESGLMKTFLAEFVDVLLLSAKDYWGPAVSTYMEQNPSKTNIIIGFEYVEPKTGTKTYMGPKYGKKIVECAIFLENDTSIDGKWWPTAGGKNIGDVTSGAFNLVETPSTTPNWDPAPVQEAFKSKALSRPRTVNYISNILEMTGLLTDRPGEIISVFDDGRGSCKDLGFNFEKRQAASYVATFTTGLQVKTPPASSIGPAWSKIGKDEFVDPANEYWDTSAKNWESSFNDTFDEEAALRAMGDMCTMEDLYKEFFDKLDLASLLCDWLKCIRLPGFDIKLPSFYLPPFPRIPVLGWYAAVWRFLQDNIKQILIRIACSFARALIDKLAIPFCEEQLRDFVAAGSLTGDTAFAPALAASLVDIGIAPERKESAKVFFEDVANITTGQELCRLLSGKPLDNASMLMVQRLLEKNGLEGDLVNESDILNYFDLIGTLLPYGICEELQKSTTLATPKSCVEISDYLSDIRNRLQTGDSTLSDEEIDKVVQMAKDEMNKKQDDLRALSGNNVGNLIPDAYRPGDPSAIVSDYPDFLKKELDNTIKNCFSGAKDSYVSALDAYVPAMSLNLPTEPEAGTDQYSDSQSLKFEASLTQLAAYVASLENQTPAFNQYTQQVLGQGPEEITQDRAQELINKGGELYKRAKKLKELIEFHKQCFVSSGRPQDGRRKARPGAGKLYIDGPPPPAQVPDENGQIRLVAEQVHTIGWGTDGEEFTRTYRPLETLVPGSEYEDFLSERGFAWEFHGLSYVLFHVITGALRGYWQLHRDNSSFDYTNLPTVRHVPVFIQQLEVAAGLRGNAFMGTDEESPSTAVVQSLKFIIDNYRDEMITAAQEADDEYQRRRNSGDPDSLGQEEEPAWLTKLFELILDSGRFQPDLSSEDQERYQTDGLPYLSFQGYYDEHKDNIWQKDPFQFSNEEDLDYSTLTLEKQYQYAELFREYRITNLDELLEDIDSLIREFEIKNNETGDWDPIPRLGVNNPYSPNSVTEQEFIDYFIAPEKESGVPYDSEVRSAKFLDYIIKISDPTKDIFSGALMKLNTPVDVNWYNAMLLYTLFETEEVPFKEVEGKTHHVFAKNRVTRSPKDFVMACHRPSGGPLDALVDRELTTVWRFNAEGAPRMEAQGGSYRGVLNQLERGAAGYEFFTTGVESISYEEYYESITDPDSRGEFVLSAIPLERYTGMVALRGFSDSDYQVFQQIVSEISSRFSDDDSPVACAEIREEFKHIYEEFLSSRDGSNSEDYEWNIYQRKSLETNDSTEGTPYHITSSLAAAAKAMERHFSLDINLSRDYEIRDTALTHFPQSARFRLLYSQALAEIEYFRPYMPSVGDGGPRSGGFKLNPWLAASLDNPLVPESLRLKSTLEVFETIQHAITNSIDNRGSYVREGRKERILSAVTDAEGIHHFESVATILDQRGPNHPGLLKLINERLTGLTDTIIETFRNRPSIVTPKHLLMLDKVMNNTEILKSSGTAITELSLQLGLYHPKIEYIEYPSKTGLERYDITISSDFHLGQPNDTKPKTFKFCEPLPLSMTRHNRPDPGHLPVGQNEEKYYSKRESFMRLAIQSIQGGLGYRAPRGTDNLKKKLYEDLFLEKQQNIMSSLLDEIRDSRLFDKDYAEELDRRISAKPSYNESTGCVTNRYGLVEASSLSFDKVILEETHAEIMKETAKPENSTVNRDFDDPGPIDIAMQSISLKAFVRVCILDTMLKGGLAYSVWDIEPIISDPLFIEYVIEHVKGELESSSFLRSKWRRIVEKTVGITNPNSALRRLIEQEIIKFPDFSKQAFNFDRRDVDFYDWYTEEKIGGVQELTSDIEFFQYRRELEDNNSTALPFVSPQDSHFFLEDYVRISGEILDPDLLSELEDARRGLETEHPDFSRAYFAIENPEEKEIVFPTWAFDSLIKVLSGHVETVRYRNIIEQSEFHHGIRLISKFYDEDLVEYLKNNYQEDIHENSRIQKSFLVAEQNEAGPLGLTRSADYSAAASFREIVHLPLVSEERVLDLETCESIFSGRTGTGVIHHRKYMVSRLKAREEYRHVFDHIFPIRRYMTINSIFATAVLSGYNGLPTLFSPTKAAIAFLGMVASTPMSQRDQLIPLSAADFRNIMKNNWPTHPESADCFDFPLPSAEFFIKFIKDLWKLITELPSILFRGVANVIDPAYKEMRQHYLNCDIKNLSWEGLSVETLEDSLVNGLYLPGGPDAPRGKNNGKYAPIVHTGAIDMLGSLAHLLAWNPKPLGITLAKTISYAFSGNLPMLDLSMAFAIPCLDVSEAWAPKPEGKYDIGQFGRYGHPLSPFTVLALSTPQLESDKNLKRPNCSKIKPAEYTECDEE